jgi:pentose-5-phosphate-3-epimerase
MSVNPGFGGQKFMPEVLDKIKELKKIQSEKNINFDIEIDGGINFDNCKAQQLKLVLTFLFQEQLYLKVIMEI